MAGWAALCKGSPCKAANGTRKFWRVLQAESPDNLKIVLKAWKVFSDQLKSRADRKRKCLVEHGDVERQPGPESSPLNCPYFPKPHLLFARSKALADRAFQRLIEQGIEPHPGPGQNVSVVSCNTGGVPGAWRALRLLTYGSVLLMQDTPFSQAEAEAFSKAAKRSGSRMHWTPGRTSGTRKVGGLTALVPQAMRQQPSSGLQNGTVEMLCTWVQGIAILNYYFPP